MESASNNDTNKSLKLIGALDPLAIALHKGNLERQIFVNTSDTHTHTHSHSSTHTIKEGSDSF